MCSFNHLLLLIIQFNTSSFFFWFTCTQNLFGIIQCLQIYSKCTHNGHQKSERLFMNINDHEKNIPTEEEYRKRKM